MSTFCSLEEAAAAVRTGEYAGIGVNISGSLGCIDVDHCISDGTASGGVAGEASDKDTTVISDTAQDILDVLPSAYAEYSPSRTGLHLFFTVPDGFAFDRERYFINNRSIGVEIYLPNATKRFMTVTGEAFRSGDMSVTEAQLMAFLDKFMKRPDNTANAASPPSILTDADVIYKLSSDPDGARFMSLYRGELESAAPDGTQHGADATASEANQTWSRSEADMSLCSKLAFYCRGDMEQMDRLFRASGLMRPKWDERHGAETYGEMTVRNAISHCTAFYEPQENSTAAEDFTVIDHAAVIDTLLENGPTVESVLSEDALTAAAWAYKKDTLRYTRLRQAVPKEIGIRNYERAVKQRLSSLQAEEGSETHSHAELLALKGISAPGMLVPPGWTIDDSGIYYLGSRASADPLFICSKMENVDDGTEKLEIRFRRNGRYKTLIAPRSDMLNKNSIIRYADSGLPVSSGNAALLTAFIAAMESTNDRSIPLKRCIRRAGWVGDMSSCFDAHNDIHAGHVAHANKIGAAAPEFFPYYLNSPMTAQEDEENAERFLEHLKTSGSEELWMQMADKVRTLPFARAMLAASFASVLLYPLQHRNIYYHAWCDSKSGKTAALKFAMSVWGDPQALVKSYFATMVGMEHRAGTMKHLPLALDELQTLDKRMDINNMVYTLGNGVGKTRGRAGGGIRAIDDWRNCILSTGEQPISSDNSMDGINTRLLEINACPVTDEAMASRMHQVSELNYGFAGEKYIRWLIDNVIRTDGTVARENISTAPGMNTHSEAAHGVVAHSDVVHSDVTHSVNGMNRISADFESIRSSLDTFCADRDVKADNIAVLSLADYYASIAVFGMAPDAAFGEAIELGSILMGVQRQEDHTDTVDRAWNFVTGWVASNKNRFSTSSITPLEVLGVLEDGRAFVISGTLNDALEDAGFSYKKCIRGFGQRGYIVTFPDSEGEKRTQLVKRVNGINTRVYQLNMELGKEEEKPLFSD